MEMTRISYICVNFHNELLLLIQPAGLETDD